MHVNTYGINYNPERCIHVYGMCVTLHPTAFNGFVYYIPTWVHSGHVYTYEVITHTYVITTYRKLCNNIVYRYVFGMIPTVEGPGVH